MLIWIRGRRSQRVFAGMATAGMLLFALSLVVLMLPHSRIIEEQGGLDLTCLHVPFTAERATEIVASYSEEARAAARSLHLPGDIIFPIGYALLYSGLVGLIVRRLDGPWLLMGMVALALPFGAMVFDWAENLFILRILAVPDSSPMPGWIPLLGGLAGTIKYLLLSVLTPLYGVTAVGYLVFVRRGTLAVGDALLYAFVVGLLLFNVFRLFSDVFPCFSGV